MSENGMRRERGKLEGSGRAPDRIEIPMSEKGAITPEELAERGWDGASRCRCLAEGEGYVPCPPQMCDAEALLEECRDLSRLHRIAVGLLTDEQLSDYRRVRDSNE